MKTALLLLLTLSGCAPYAAVQVDLIDQSRLGVTHARATAASLAESVDQLHALQRQRLDTAFDADVRERPSLDAAWVIEHRKVYAIALDAMAEQRFTHQQRVATAQGNLDAIDQALMKLRYLQSVPLSWFEKSER